MTKRQKQRGNLSQTERWPRVWEGTNCNSIIGERKNEKKMRKISASKTIQFTLREMECAVYEYAQTKRNDLIKYLHLERFNYESVHKYLIIENSQK